MMGDNGFDARSYRAGAYTALVAVLFANTNPETKAAVEKVADSMGLVVPPDPPGDGADHG